MDLQVDVQRAGRGRHEPGRPRLARIRDVDDAEPSVACLTNVGMPVVDHDLDAVWASTLVGVAQKF